MTIDGEEYWTDQTAAVKVPAIAATLIDINGLQTDGTGLVGDRLRVTYTDDLGTPSSIAWYKDGAALISTRADAGALVFTINTNEFGATLNGNDAEDAGDWYAIISDKDGNFYESNHIEIVWKGDIAEMSDVSFSEDTTNSTTFDIAATTEKMILNVTLNKDYTGTFYIFSDTEEDFKKGNAVADGAAPAGYATTLATAVVYDTQMTDGAVTASANKAIKYTEVTTGEVSYKIQLKTSTTKDITRGSKYYVVFDQANTDQDDIGGGAQKNANKSELITAPYVTAPAAITVPVLTKTGTGATAVVTAQAKLFSDSTAETAMGFLKNNASPSTLTDTNAQLGIKMYAVTDAKNENGTSMTNASVVLGGGQTDSFTITDTNQDIYGVYAVVKTVPGVYGEKSVEIKSDVRAIPADAATSISVGYSKKNPDAVKVSIKALKTSGEIRIGTATRDTDDDTTASNIVKSLLNNEKVLASQTVQKGTTEFTFEDVISGLKDRTNGDTYAAVFVPDSDDFGPVAVKIDHTATGGAAAGANGNDGYLQMKQVQTSYGVTGTTTKQKLGSATGNGVSGGVAKQLATTLIAYDQFGDEMTAISAALGGAATPAGSTSLTPVNGDSKDQTVVVGIGTDLKIYADSKDDAGNVGAAKGDVYKYKIEDGWFLTLTCSTAGLKADSEWTVSITN